MGTGPTSIYLYALSYFFEYIKNCDQVTPGYFIMCSGIFVFSLWCAYCSYCLIVITICILILSISRIPDFIVLIVTIVTSITTPNPRTLLGSFKVQLIGPLLVLLIWPLIHFLGQISVNVEIMK